MDKLTPCPFILTLLWFCHIPDILYQVLHFFVELGTLFLAKKSDILYNSLCEATTTGKKTKSTKSIKS